MNLELIQYAHPQTLEDRIDCKPRALVSVFNRLGIIFNDLPSCKPFL
jgi:hypothetical protein